MKSKIMSLVVAAALLVSSCGTTRTSTSSNAAYNVQVPAGIQSTFATQFPDATNIVWDRYDGNTVPIDWELTDWSALDTDDYVVTFNVGKEKFYSWYDSNGAWIGGSYGIADYSKLPTAVHNTLKRDYQGYAIVDVDKEMWSGKTAYEVKLNRDEKKIKVLIDDNGIILKKKLKD